MMSFLNTHVIPEGLDAGNVAYILTCMVRDDDQKQDFVYDIGRTSMTHMLPSFLPKISSFVEHAKQIRRLRVDKSSA